MLLSEIFTKNHLSDEVLNLKGYLEDENISPHKIIINEDIRTYPFLAGEYIDQDNQVYQILPSLDIEMLKLTRFPEVLREMEKSWISKNYTKHLSFTHRRFYHLYFEKLYSLLWDLKSAELTIEDWWSLFEHIWIDSEYLNLSVNQDMLIEAFKNNPHIRTQRKMLDKHTNNKGELKIYRGEASKSLSHKKGALSWTLSEELAKWFANRFNTFGEVYAITVKLNDVLAYINSRNEEEIIVDFTSLRS